MKADLHIHSKFSSDGEAEVDHIAQMCVAAGVDVFTVSDHNSVQGNEQAASEAVQRDLVFVPGIEIDCNYRGTDLHLLGLGIDWRSRDFAVLEEEVARKVVEAFDEMIHNLSRLGIEVDARQVIAKGAGKLPSAELIAEVLLSGDNIVSDKLEPYMPGGSRSNMPYLNFYFDFFAQGAPAYVKIDFMEYSQAVDLVSSNGGKPVIAHPGLNFKGRETVAEELLCKGAQGLEAFNNYHDAAQSDYFAHLAVGRKALVTCGSDYHGKIKPGIDIGCYSHVGIYADYLEQSVRRMAFS